MSILNQFKLSERVAIITGGAQGLGKAMAAALAEAGAKVVIADIDFELAKKTVEEFEKQGMTAYAIEVDVTKPKQVEAMVSDTVGKFTQLDILVTSAGIVKDSPIEETS